MREEARKRFAREIASRVDSLRGAVKDMKGDIMGPGKFAYVLLTNLNLTSLIADGLTHVFATIKETPNVRDLPPNYHAVLEWARIS